MKAIHYGIMAVSALALLAPSARAQAPGGMQMNPQAQAKMKAWQTWRNNHKNVQSLQQTLGALQYIQQDPKTRLNKAQSKTILGVLKAWRSKPTMTDAQALKVNKQLTTPLTLQQLKKLATAPRGGRRNGGGGGGGMGRPGGGGAPGGPGGGRPGGGFDASRIPAPKDYNPLNPDTLPIERMRGRAKDRLNALTSALAAQAK
ncbi:MAG TPA: hypothetical protein VGM37_02420 [Armatimonadota bacterium]|jgi:uncharacterized membrane protein YgcG